MWVAVVCTEAEVGAFACCAHEARLQKRIAMTQVVSVNVGFIQTPPFAHESPTLTRFLQWSAGTARGKFGYRRKLMKKEGLLEAFSDPSNATLEGLVPIANEPRGKRSPETALTKVFGSEVST